MDYVSERVRNSVVYLQPYKVTIIFLVEDIISLKLVGHNGSVFLAYLFQYIEKLFSA